MRNGCVGRAFGVNAPRIRIREIDLAERAIHFRLPFRFGAATLTEAAEACVRVRAQVEGAGEALGYAAEMMMPKWFDKNPAASNEDNIDQLRASLHVARESLLREARGGCAFEHFAHQYTLHVEHALNPLAASYGPALIDRAIIDALCRAFGVSFYGAMRRNLIGL